MKECKSIHPLLSLHLEGALSQKEKTLVERHLEVCITARREREQFERLRLALLEQPSPRPPADLHWRIMERLGMAGKAAPKVIPWKRPFMLAAAMLLVVLFLDRLPEWRQETLTPGQGEFAPQPVLTPMEQPALARSGPALKEKSRSLGKAKKSEVKAAKKAPAAQTVPAQLRKKEVLASRDDLASDQTAGASLKDQPDRTAPSAALESRSAAAPEAPAEAERDLNTLTLSRNIAGLHWRGDHAPEEGAQERLLTDLASFRTVWQTLRPGQKEPVIDMEKDAVVYLTAGMKPTTGYTILIVGLQDREDTFAVLYRVQATSATALAAQVMTHPWILQVIPKPDKPVTFIKEE